MKKFWLFIIFTTFVAFGSLQAERKLTSASFDVPLSELKDTVSGYYLDYTLYYSAGLKTSWVIVNTSSATVTFNVTLERIRIDEAHTLEYCIGNQCSFFGNRQTWVSPYPMELAPGESTNPALNSYLTMYSGNDSSDAVASIDTVRVTYRNLNNEADYVTFLCIWDFTVSSIKFIEDISGKIFPNPTSEQLNLTWNENNINEIEFFDISGNKLLSKDVTNLSEVNVDISLLNAGTYVGYLVQSGKRVKVFRFVKN